MCEVSAVHAACTMGRGWGAGGGGGGGVTRSHYSDNTTPGRAACGHRIIASHAISTDRRYTGVSQAQVQHRSVSGGQAVPHEPMLH